METNIGMIPVSLYFIGFKLFSQNADGREMEVSNIELSAAALLTNPGAYM